MRRVVLRRLFDEVEHVVNGFLRVISRNSRLDICEKLLIVLDCLRIISIFELRLEDACGCTSE